MAPAEDDISIEEKRVYAGSAGRTDAYLAADVGVVRVAISGDKVGPYELVARDAARDVAVLGRPDAPDLIAVATDHTLAVASAADDPTFDPVGLGASVAVGVSDGGFLAADATDELHRVNVRAAPEPAGSPTTDTTRIGSVDDPRRIDGPLVAAADGVHRVTGTAAGAAPTVETAGLANARDVSGAGVPLAATASGLYWLGNGWMPAAERPATAVAADGNGHAMAVVDGTLRVHPGGAGVSGSPAGTVAETRWDADAWTETALPVDERPVALGYGPGLSAVVTAAGTVCVNAGDGWRHQALGIGEIGGVALAAAA